MVFPNYQNIYQYLNYFNSMIDRPQVLIAIQNAIKNKKLKKKFNNPDIIKACPGFAHSTYASYLPKHRKGNPGGYIEYFKRNSDGTYSLL